MANVSAFLTCGRFSVMEVMPLFLVDQDVLRWSPCCLLGVYVLARAVAVAMLQPHSRYRCRTPSMRRRNDSLRVEAGTSGVSG